MTYTAKQLTNKVENNTNTTLTQEMYDQMVEWGMIKESEE